MKNIDDELQQVLGDLEALKNLVLDKKASDKSEALLLVRGLKSDLNYFFEALEN